MRWTGCWRCRRARSRIRSRLREGEHALDALLWVGLEGDPLISLPPDRTEPDTGAAWAIGLYVLPASLLVVELGPTFGVVARVRLHGGEGALRACASAMDAWRRAGAPGPGALELTVEPSRDRTGWTLPYRDEHGAVTLVRGAHRWTLRHAPVELTRPRRARRGPR